MFYFSRFIDDLVDYLDSLGVTFALQDIKRALYMKLNNPVELQMKFIEDLNEWNKDGSNILEALREIRNSSIRCGKKNSFNERAATDIINALENGKSVSEGMKNCFDRDVISLFHIGETTNTVDVLTSEYIKNEKEQKEVKKGSIGKLMYPMFMLLVVIGFMVAINDYGVPKLNEMGLHVDRVKNDAKRLLEWSAVVSIVWSPLSWFLTALWLLYIATKDKYFQDLAFLPDRKWFDKLPHYSIHKQLTAMKLIKQISMLSKAGLPLKKTVSVLMESATSYERYYLNKMDILLGNETGTIATYLDVGLLNEDLFQRLASLAKQEGELSKMNAIFVAGERSGEAARAEIKRNMKFLVPIIWLVMVTLLLVVILGVISFQGNAKNLI